MNQLHTLRAPIGIMEMNWLIWMATIIESRSLCQKKYSPKNIPKNLMKSSNIALKADFFFFRISQQIDTNHDATQWSNKVCTYLRKKNFHPIAFHFSIDLDLAD